VASYLSFPGSFKSVQRDIERDYSRRLVQKVQNRVRFIKGVKAQSYPS